MRAEFRRFENRHIAFTARILYKVGQILLSLQSLLRLMLKTNLEKYREIVRESEKSARVNITRRTPLDDEVIGRLKSSFDPLN